MSGPRTASQGDPLAVWVSTVTGIGTALAIGLVVAGLALALYLGEQSSLTGRGLLERIAEGGAGGIVSVGLLVLALTPAAQLAAAAAAFARRGEHRYLSVSLVVLVLLAAGIVAATLLSRSVGA